MSISFRGAGPRETPSRGVGSLRRPDSGPHALRHDGLL